MIPPVQVSSINTTLPDIRMARTEARVIFWQSASVALIVLNGVLSAWLIISELRHAGVI